MIPSAHVAPHALTDSYHNSSLYHPLVVRQHSTVQSVALSISAASSASPCTVHLVATMSSSNPPSIPSMCISISSQRRLFPLLHHTIAAPSDASPQSHCQPLSIVDQTLSGGPLAGCVWLYDPVPITTNIATSTTSFTPHPHDIEQLTTSLRHTLSHYPFFCGQLEPRPVNPHGDHTQRPGCVQLRWGEETDPGAELAVARAGVELAAVVPSFAERAERGGVWLNETWPKAELFTSTQLATTGGSHEGLPCMSVQLTKFACGGLGISARWPHTICDCTTIMGFMRNFATVHRALLAGQDPATAITQDTAPRFEPQLVDQCAAANVELSAALPRLNWDWWATSEEGCPSPLKLFTRRPDQFTRQQCEPFGEPATWLPSWDLNQTTSTCLIDFSRQELDAMLHEARTRQQHQTDVPARVSVNDVVLAHMGREICRARGMHEDDEPVHLTLALNLRPRLNPPLPATYVGSPIDACLVTHTGRHWCTAPLSQLAACIRRSVSAFTPTAVSALLYDMSRELTPHRRLTWCVGRHLCSGSWEREGVYELEFGAGWPRMVQYGPGPDMSGVIHLLKPRKQDGDGLTVMVAQGAEVVQRLVSSPTLRRFRSTT